MAATYNDKDDIDIHEADITVGMDLRGSVVVKVRHEIKETEDRYRLKKFITLLNGIEIISTYIRTKSEGLSAVEKLGEVSLSPAELEQLKNRHKKDDSEARAKARAMLAKKKNPQPTPPQPPPSPPKKPKTITLRVNKPDGKTTFQLEDVNPTDTVQTIKDRIASQENIPVEKQILQFKGKDLDSQPLASMTELGIKDMSTLDLLDPTLTLKAKSPDGKVVTIPGVKKTDTLDDVKAKIIEKGIPVDGKWLFHNDDKLDDPKKTMDDYGISDGSTIDVVEPTFTVKAKSPDGKVVTIPGVKKNDTLDDVKAKIVKKGIPVDGKWLLHNDDKLDDPKKTMDDYGIRDGSTIDVVEPTFSVKAKSPDGKVVTIPGVKKTDTLDDVKAKIAKKGIPVDGKWLLHNDDKLDDPKKTMGDYGIGDGSTIDVVEPTFTVKAKSPDGKVVTIPDVKKTDTLDDVKAKIVKKGIPVDGKWLLHNDDKLDDPKKTMDDYDISDGSTIDVVEPTFSVKAKSPDGKVVTIPGVKKTDTLDDVKAKIAKKGIPVDGKWLLHNDDKLDDPKKTMGDYGIGDGSTIDVVEPTFTVKAKSPDGKVVTIPDVKKTDTLDDVKAKIVKKGIPVDGKWLLHNDDKLDDPKKTMDDYGIGDGSTIDVVEPTFSVKAKSPDGKVVTIPGVKKSDTLDDVKAKIVKKGIPVDGKWLLHNDDKLDDPKKTMDDYGIGDGSTIDVVEPTFSVKAKSPDGKVVTIPGVKKSDTLDDVKAKIAKKGIPVDGKWLLHNDDKLDDPEKTMDDYGISDGSTIDVVEPTFSVKAKSPDGKVVTIPGVKKTDTLDDVKAKIVKKGIPVDGKWLLHNDDKLDDPKKTMDDYGIRDGSTIDVVEPTFKIHVKTAEGQIYDIPDLKGSNTIHDVLSKVEKVAGIPVKEQRLIFQGKQLSDPTSTLDSHGINDGSTLDLLPMTINIRLFDGTITPLVVKSTNRIRDVKQMVLPLVSSLPSEEYVGLLFEKKTLNDSNTLEECNVVHGSVLDLASMEVLVRRPNGEVFTITTQPLETIKALKKRIEKQEKIPRGDQRLFFGSNELENEPTVYDYKILPGSQLDLKTTMNIKVRQEDGTMIDLEVKPTQTILATKEQLKGLTKVPVDEQSLKKGATDLDDDKKTLKDYSVFDGAILDLALLRKGMQIHVEKEWDKKKLTLEVEKNNTILSVKEKIQAQENIAIPQQHLVFKGLVLENKPTLFDYLIKNDALLTLEKMKIYVKSSSGKFTLSDIEPATTIGQIKELIEKKTKIAPKDQKLTYGHIDLELNHKTLSDQDIRHKSVLNLDKDEEIPEYDVKLTGWQSSFDFKGKDGIKHVGKRKKKPPGQEY